jgi:hypothetical protein
MAEKKNRVNTDELFTGLIGRKEEVQESAATKTAAPAPATAPALVVAPVQNSKVGRKAGEVKKQVSIYLSPEMDKELSVQGAMKEKEADKSAIARTGIEIALALSVQTYLELKGKAEAAGKSIGDIVQEVLAKGV